MVAETFAVVIAVVVVVAIVVVVVDALDGDVAIVDIDVEELTGA